MNTPTDKAIENINLYEEVFYEKFEPDQKNTQDTGLPDSLKSAMEDIAGCSIADTKLYAYAQGTAIHIAPGQEKHLPHEAWQAVQQKQGMRTSSIDPKASPES